MLEYDGEGVARRILEAIREEKVTQTALAEVAEVTKEAVSQWCQTGQIAAKHLPAISQKLDRTIDYLLTGHGIKRLSEALVKADSVSGDLLGLTDEQKTEVLGRKAKTERLAIDFYEQNLKSHQAIEAVLRSSPQGSPARKDPGSPLGKRETLKPAKLGLPQKAR